MYKKYFALLNKPIFTCKSIRKNKTKTTKSTGYEINDAKILSLWIVILVFLFLV